MLRIINGSLESEITPEESEREEITHYINSADTKYRFVQFLCSFLSNDEICEWSKANI